MSYQRNTSYFYCQVCHQRACLWMYYTCAPLRRLPFCVSADQLPVNMTVSVMVGYMYMMSTTVQHVVRWNVVVCLFGFFFICCLMQKDLCMKVLTTVAGNE